MDAGVHTVTDDRAELPAAGIDEFPSHKRPVVFSVVTEVGRGRARSEIHVLSQH